MLPIGICQAVAKPRIDLTIRRYEMVPRNEEFEMLMAVGYRPSASITIRRSRLYMIAVGKNNLAFRYYKEWRMQT